MRTKGTRRVPFLHEVRILRREIRLHGASIQDVAEAIVRRRLKPTQALITYAHTWDLETVRHIIRIATYVQNQKDRDSVRATLKNTQ